MVAAYALFLAALSGADANKTMPAMRDIDRTRIAEAFRLADALANRVWPDWDKAPFALLLVTPEHELLVRHPNPTPDFTLLGEDPVLKQKVWFRKRVFSTRLLATFPAVAGASTIVVGQAENTEFKTSARWVITVLHEHFHQLQHRQPRYQAGVDGLGLARGDQTGMWMLNYPFPYTSARVKSQYAVVCKALAEALHASGESEFRHKLAAYVQARNDFRALVKPDDFKYLSFQLWQEGVARYTEYHLAELAARRYVPSQQFQALKDYTTFKEVARTILRGIDKDLAAADLAKSQRTVVYSWGAAEGLVLDRANPNWRKRYFQDAFSLDKHFGTQP